MASKAEGLERILASVKQEYGKLERRLHATQNIHRAQFNRTYGVDPPWYQSDSGCDGGEEEDGGRESINDSSAERSENAV